MRVPAFLLAAGLLLSPQAPQAQVAGEAASRSPVATTPHFALYSDFETNLNDALVEAGRARDRRKPELFRSGAEAPCFERLPPSARAAWEGAVEYYSKIISVAEWSDRQQFLIRLHLVGFDAEWKASGGTEFVGIARGFRLAAAPAYRACRWAAQDEKNRRWIAELKPRLEGDEGRLASRLQQLYRTKWKTLPILVDVVETVDWSGANSSWSDAGQGDLLITSTVQGPAAFELVFHEASHVLMDRNAPVRQALDAAAQAAGFPLPGELWHVVLFYTTGEVVRPVVDERGPAGYTPMLYDIMARSSWKEYREALEAEWLPYVQGKRSLEEAATGLIAALKKAKAPAAPKPPVP